MVLYGGRVKKPTRKESEAKNKKNCLQEGDMKKVKEDQGSYGSRWMFLAMKDGGDQQQLNNEANEVQIHV